MPSRLLMPMHYHCDAWECFLSHMLHLQKRDPGRIFVLGERLSYILLPGLRTQDEAAEDPLTAAKAGCAADYELYWQNKLRKPLTEILTTCLTPTALQVRLGLPATI